MSNNNNWKRVGGFSRTGTQNYVRTNDAAMGGTTFGSTDVSYNTGNSTLRIGNNAGVVFINGDIDMSGGPGVGAPINRVRNVRDPIADHDVATKFYVDKAIDSITSRDSGDKGDTGEQGPPGVGFAGQNGSDGPTGATGCTGAIGPPGPVVGVKGPTGDSGAKGATGANGAAGATGPIGPIGEKGTQGTQGTQGIQGSNGTILWLNPDGDSQVNQLITDSYMLSTVPIISSMRTIGPISVSATYGNSNKMIPGSRFWNTAKKVSTLAVIPSGVWALNLYANVPSNSDANQVSLYAAVFMISGTSNQPSAASLIIETKDGGDAGFYPPRAAYLPDHVKYIGKSWTPTDNILTDTTANLGAVIDSTTRKLYKIEMPVEFTTLKDASGNTENVYVQLQIYIKNTMAAKQTGNINLFYQTDVDTNATTYSYLQTTFGAVGIEGSQGTTGPIGLQGAAGATGPAGTVGATGAVGPTGTTGSRGPEGPKGPTGPTGPAGQSNSVGRQYTVQYRSNEPLNNPNNDADVSGSFAGNANFRYIPDGSTINASTATTGTLVLNDIACKSIHSSFYVEDPSITGSSIRPRTFVKGGELVLGSGGGYIVLASGKNASASGPFSPATAADITHGIKLVHNIEGTPPTATLNLHNNSTSKVGIKFDLSNGNVIAATDQFCIVHETGAVGVGGITQSQMAAESGLNRGLHVRGNIMVGTHPGAGTDASSAMILLNKATTTPGAPFSTYPGVYHRSIADTTEATAVGGITAGTAGLGLISPNFITFQTGTSLGSNSIVINQAGDVSVTGRANLNGAVSVGKNFVAVTAHDNKSPNMDVSGILHIISGVTEGYTDNPRMKLISNVIDVASALPTLSATNTANEIRGVNTSTNSGFLRLSAQTPANSCIDLIGVNTYVPGLSNSVRISTAGAPIMVINGSGNVGIGTMAPTTILDVSGIITSKTGIKLGPNSTTAMTSNSSLDINNSTIARSRFTCNSNLLTLGMSSEESFFWNENAIRMAFGTSNTRRMTISATGKVGIGTVEPEVDLDVSGAARVTALLSTATALTTTGRIGVNKSSPTVDLDVVGAARITGNLDMNSSGKIVNLVNPTAAQDAATKGYVDGRFVNASISTATIGSTSDENFAANSLDSKLAICHGTSPKIYISTSASAVGGLLIGKDAQRAYVDNRESGGELAIVTEQNIPIVFKTNAANVSSGSWGTNRMVITGEKGLVGIGTDNPRAPLEIGLFPANDTGYLGAKYVGIWADGFIQVNGTYYGDYDMSIFAPRYIATSKGFILWSDARIKRDIVDLEDNESLIKLRKLQPKKFTIVSSNLLIGKVENKYGFIAQEVEEVLEHSVIKTKEIIPNFMVHIKLNKYTGYIDQPVDYSNNKTYYLLEYASLTPETYDINYKFNITGNHDISGNEYKTNTQEPASDQSGNQVFKLLFYSKTAEKYEVFTKKIINDKTLLIYSDKILDEDIYLLVGQEVDDFRVLDKDPIATITTAAIQEVDRQQQADKARIAELENQVSNLEATVASQQSIINDILERLKKLEA
jgi:hypothetical protein